MDINSIPPYVVPFVTPKYIPETIHTDVAAFALKDIRRMGRAKRIHMDKVHMAKNRRTAHNVLNWDPYWDEPWDDEIPRAHMPKAAEPNRWNKFSWSPAENKFYKKHYDALDVEKFDHFCRVDAKQERLDEKRSEAFRMFLLKQKEAEEVANKLADEYEDRLLENLHIINTRYWVADCNHPGIVFVSKCREHIVKFRIEMEKEGASMGRVHTGNAIGDVPTWDVCNIDKEWSGRSGINPFYFWYYTQE